MKNVEFEIPVKVAENVEFTVKGSYLEPEKVEEIDLTDPKTLQIYKTGLRQIKRNEVRANHNFAPVAKKLFEMNLFSSVQEALDMILLKKGLKK